jgi:hypothetical protein
MTMAASPVLRDYVWTHREPFTSNQALRSWLDFKTTADPTADSEVNHPSAGATNLLTEYNQASPRSGHRRLFAHGAQLLPRVLSAFGTGGERCQ